METNEELIKEARSWNEAHLRDYNYTSCNPFCPGGEHEHGLTGAERLIARLADALEAAATEPEWEWGYAGETLVGVHNSISREAAEEDVANLRRYWNDERKFWVVRRTPASEWLPVEGESKP